MKPILERVLLDPVFAASEVQEVADTCALPMSDGNLRIEEDLSTIAERSKRVGLMNMAQSPAMILSPGFREGCSFSRAFENQQLMLDEQRFGDDGSNAAWSK